MGNHYLFGLENFCITWNPKINRIRNVEVLKDWKLFVANWRLINPQTAQTKYIYILHFKPQDESDSEDLKKSNSVCVSYPNSANALRNSISLHRAALRLNAN